MPSFLSIELLEKLRLEKFRKSREPRDGYIEDVAEGQNALGQKEVIEEDSAGVNQFRNILCRFFCFSQNVIKKVFKFL